jgi:hypothetical protein
MGGWAYLLWFLYKRQRIPDMVVLLLQTVVETERGNWFVRGIELTATV